MVFVPVLRILKLRCPEIDRTTLNPRQRPLIAWISLVFVAILVAISLISGDISILACVNRW